MIGAGSSGIASCQVLTERGIPFDCFEKGSAVGGNWRYENDNEMSSAYRSLHINTSRGQMAYASYPMPDDYPDYPDHFQIARYFDDYVDHFGFRERIRFRTEVLSVEPADGEWEVTIEDDRGRRESGRYGAVLVANGHHWDPRWPEPPFPGSDEFLGEQMHVHHYREPDVLRGKRVLVLGIGNSATDIAVESSRVADATFLAMRRGAYVIPKYLRGRPTDETGSRALCPAAAGAAAAVLHGGAEDGDRGRHLLRPAAARPQAARGAPTVSSELLPRIGHGDITVKPNIERFEGHRVRFVDGSEEEIDLVIYCTGYKITFPVPRPLAALGARQPHRPLPPGGLGRAPGPLLHRPDPAAGGDHADRRAAVAMGGRPARGEGRPPRPGADAQGDRADPDARMARRYVASKRHTIQVDFHPYMRELRRERRRARASPRTPSAPSGRRRRRA